MVRWVSLALSEPVWCERDEHRLWVDEEHFLGTRLLSSKTSKSTSSFWLVFLGHGAVENSLCLLLIVDACIVAPAVGGKNQCCDKVQFTIGSGSIGIAGAISFTTPGKIAFTGTILMLHIFLTPSPETVEYIFFV